MFIVKDRSTVIELTVTSTSIINHLTSLHHDISYRSASNDRAKSTGRRLYAKTSGTVRIDDESRFLTDPRMWIIDRSFLMEANEATVVWAFECSIRFDRSLLRLTMHSSVVRSNCSPPHTRHYGHDTLRIRNIPLNPLNTSRVLRSAYNDPTRYEEHCRNYYQNACIGFDFLIFHI